MTHQALQHQLHNISRQLARWQAELRAAFWAALLLGVLFIMGAADLLLHLGSAGRLAAWSILLVVAATGVWRVLRAAAQRHTTEAVAAQIEGAFPQLDNHLINYVQFTARPNGDSLSRAYVQRGLPEWSVVDVRQMKDRRRHRQLKLVLGGVTVVLLLPLLWAGRGWTNAMARVLNPFSTRSAATLAELISVTPGDHEVITGSALAFACQATGQSGQEVWLDLWPADDKPASIKLGQLEHGTTGEFAYTLPRVTAGMEYRFRAGDAESDRFAIRVIPPLALTVLDVTVQPPPHTGLPGGRVNALTDPVTAPAGADLVVELRANRELAGATVTDAKALRRGESWSVTVPVAGRAELPVTVAAANGETLATVLALQVIPDRQPVLRILAPTSRVALAPGATARIEAQAEDDYGVAEIWLEDVDGARVTEWQPANARLFAVTWTGGPGKYRLVARDAVQETRSPVLVFDVAKPNEVVEQQARNASQAAATLARLVALQRENLEKTTGLHDAVATATAAQWGLATDAQRTIRQLAGTLIADPRKPLGALGGSVTELHRGAMAEVIDTLDRLPTAPADQRAEFSLRAIGFETTILRVLTETQQHLDRVDRHRQISDLLAMLDALVSGEEALVKLTKPLAGGLEGKPIDVAQGLRRPGEPSGTVARPDAAREDARPPAAVTKDMVDRQDRLAGDVNDFAQACRREAEVLKKSDAEFAQLILQVATGCDQREVAANLLRAAEHLDAAKPAEALPLQEKALAALKEFQALLSQWRVNEAQQTMAEVKQVVAESKAKFEKLVNLQSKVVESMRAVENQEDLTEADAEQFLEELKAVKANIRDAALKVADDLHIFPELPVGNELVQDIYQVFEEATQVPGSESAAAEELGLQKEDFILEMMEKIKERFDDMEMWLTAKPDNVKRLTENFDQQEMPKMAVIPLPEELEDIIGELQEQQDEIREQSDDSATNQAVPDLPMGWDIAEGEWSSFSAKGKSGNERPEHKDQDGRSLVGREGMADGETAAGSGKINEGDEKIDNRMTRDSAQAGQVAEEEHTDAKATGGGKLSGWDEESGMPGQGVRRDSNLPPSLIGLQAMLRRNAEAMYARASMLHIRTGSLDEAVQAMRDAEEAMQQGLPIQRVKEFQRRASVALQRAQTELGGGFQAESIAAGATAPGGQEQLAGVPDEAPAGYRDLVAEYFKSLGHAQ